MRIFKRPHIIDERFLTHRQQSTSLAGMVGVTVAMALFIFHLYADHIWNWDLLIVGITMAGVKLGAMVWYYVHD